MLMMIIMRKMRKLTSNFCSLPRSPRKVTKSVPLDFRLQKYYYDDHDCDYGGLAHHDGDGGHDDDGGDDDDGDDDDDDIFTQPFINWLRFKGRIKSLGCPSIIMRIMILMIVVLLIMMVMVVVMIMMIYSFSTFIIRLKLFP